MKFHLNKTILVNLGVISLKLHSRLPISSKCSWKKALEDAQQEPEAVLLDLRVHWSIKKVKTGKAPQLCV